MAELDPSPPDFVIAAMLAGHLFRMMRTAKIMSLSASNAKGVAARAGEKAMGFRPITDFIAEMANKTIHFATKVNQLALTLSRTSVVFMRNEDAVRRLRASGGLLQGQPSVHFIDAQVGNAGVIRMTLRAEIDAIMLQLVEQLDEIYQGVRGATVIVINSRTEASRAGEFRKYLDSIADSVESAAHDIQLEITACRKLIEELKD